tara:strand:+ start:49 stop:495 length:447 start_codon:yes stop_codon:yes gene_type:complete
MSEFFPKEETLNFPNSLITSDSSNSIIYNPSNMVEYDENFEILLNNPFFTDLAEIMQDKKITNFFDKYFKDKEEIQTTLLYMKLYREIQLKYKEKKKEEIESLTTLYVMNVIMNTPELRKKVILSVSQHYSDNNEIKKAISASNLLTN